MGFIPFFGQKKEEKKDEKGLDDLKRATLGIENQQSPPATTQTNPINTRTDEEALKEEKRIFTQITSVKELTNSEVNYELPGGVVFEEIKSTQAQPYPKVEKKEEQVQMPKTDAQKIAEQNSAYDKLLKLSAQVKEDKTKSTISSTEFQKRSVFNEKIVKRVDVNSGKIEMKSSSDTKPLIQLIKEEKKPEVEQIKEENYDWMKEPEIEEPSFEDFPIEEEPTFFAKQKAQVEEQKKIEDKLVGMRTPVDDMFDVLEKYKKIEITELTSFLKLDQATIDNIAKKFEEDGVIEIEYPTSLTKKPVIILKNPAASKLNKIPEGEVMQSYTINVDFVPAQISVILAQDEARPIYAIEMPNVGKYTRRFLNFIKDEVAETMPIELEEIVDPKKAKKLKERFFFELNSHLIKYFPHAEKNLLNMLSGLLLHEMYGLGDIEILMGDDMLEEVGINSAKTPITVYHRVHGWLKTNLMPGSEDEINNFSSQIGRKVGREITTLSPILDAHLLSGDRVNATLFPVSSEGNTITIRRFARKPWTIIDFIGKAHTMNSEMAAMLWLAMQYELNVILAGGTASGKTSTLNTLLALVPTYHRIISIEDVREIILPKYLEWNWIPLVTRSPNPEGLGEVTMLDLMVTSLRMRPDRIIVGEIRRKKEAEVLMEAIETGHSIYSTIHANSGYQVLRRLAEPPINVPLMQIELIDLIVVQYRDRKTNKRRTYEIAEIEQTSTGQGLQVNTVYKWNPRSDNWERLNKPTKLITLLNVHTGMTEEDIMKEIKEREEILEWMKRNNVSDLDQIGYLIKLFYSSPEKVKKMAKNNAPQEEINALLEKARQEESSERKQ